MTDVIPPNLQHTAIAVLLFDKTRAKLVRHLLPIEVWSSNFGIFMLMKKVYNYIDTYNEPPNQHIFDLVKELGFQPDQEDIISRVIQHCQARFDENLNFEFLMNGITKFQRQTNMRQGVQKAVEFIETGKLDEAEEVLYNTLKRKIESFDPGINVESGLAMLVEDKVNQNDVITLGIPALDKRLICPTVKELFLYLAPPKAGKSHFCIHTGKRAIQQGKRVCHITLELRDKIVLRRYLQSILNLSKTQLDDRTRYTLQNGQIEFKTVPSPQNLDDSIDFIYEQVEYLKDMLKRLWIKEFPSGTLTVNGLRAYLEALELQYEYLPDLVILDYADLMKIKNVENKRNELGQLYVELRGIANERNFALVTPSQVNRSGANSKQTQITDVAEDFSKIATADNVLTYSQTKTEREMNLARLFVGASRNEEDKFEVLITQDYATSQFVLESEYLTPEWTSRVEQIMKDKGDSNE